MVSFLDDWSASGKAFTDWKVSRQVRICASFFLLTSPRLVIDFAIFGSVRPKIKAALRAAVPAGSYEQLYIRGFLPPPTRRITMKLVRLLLSLGVFLQAVIALHGQITASSSHSDHGGFPIRFGYNHGQVGGADASGRMRAAIASVLLFFEANQGQADPRVRFLSRSGGYTLFLTPEETVLVESAAFPSAGNKSDGPRDSKPSPRAVLRMKLLGANQAQEFVGIGELPGKVNYLIGNHPGGWHTGVPLYSQVQAKQVYPGVDLLFHGDQKQLEYDFVISPGADPHQVAFQIEGAERIDLGSQGNLVLHTPENEIAFQKPLVYQPVGRERRPIEGRFVLKGPREVGFTIATYDRREPLVIDPSVAIAYSPYLGGLGQEDGR